MVDSFLVVDEDGFHFVDEFITEYLAILSGGDGEALLCVFAPFCTAEVNFRVGDELGAFFAFLVRFVLPEFDGVVAVRAFDFEDIFWFPKALVLSRASLHIDPYRIISNMRTI